MTSGAERLELHLDLMGGLAGDMFIAGVLDAFPEHEHGVVATVAMVAEAFGERRAGEAPCRRVDFNDGVLSGSRFEVGPWAEPTPVSHHDPHDHHHPHHHGHDDHHAGHVAWASIRERLRMTLPAPLASHAVAIFSLLAEAEAEVHGVAADAVEFHEVGAWDSIADICGAAALIGALGAARWTASAVPLGSGRVRTAHGPLPVPSPATALLLRGFASIDDGIAGERVTPTGAAILKYLVPTPAALSTPMPRQLQRSGVGFGTRRLAGISNCVRVLAFGRPATKATASPHRELAVVEFEVDDQSAEELAMGLDRLRRHEAIFDVVQSPVFGKKGRMMTAVRLLARPAALPAVIEACFRETTTIGLRHHRVHGAALPRRADEIEVEGHLLRVKSVDRPGGVTAKAESDDALAHESHHERQRIRREAERRLLDRGPVFDHD